jgi:hypothetical protein
MKRTLKAERSISDNIDRPKFGVCCENLAAQEGFFDAGNGVTAVEKYCHICNRRANLRLGASSFHYDMMNLPGKKFSRKFSFKASRIRASPNKTEQHSTLHHICLSPIFIILSRR